jgi:hypothetical protein
VTRKYNAKNNPKKTAKLLAANIAWENSVHPVSARTAFVLEQLYLTCYLCVQISVVNNTVLQNAADAAIKNFDAMLSDEIAKDPTAGTPFFPVYIFPCTVLTLLGVVRS